MNQQGSQSSSKSQERIYMDHAASTPVRDEVATVMDRYLRDEHGNPGAVHQEGVAAKTDLGTARKRVAQVLKTTPAEVVFTSGATESNNMAILGVARAIQKAEALDSAVAAHIVTTAFEHSSSLNPCKQLESEGIKVTYLRPSTDGFITAEQVREVLQENTVLVSVMYANNEIGTIQPIKEIARAVKKDKSPTSIHSGYPLVFTDAAQAPGVLPLDVNSLGVDLLSLSGHKCYGPKGSGVLYKRRGVEIEPLMWGGHQEDGRPGTQNVGAYIGMAEALSLAEAERTTGSDLKRLASIRDYLIMGLSEIPGLEINGSPENRVPGNLNFSLMKPSEPNRAFLSGEQVVIELDARGIAVATGSACDTGEDSGSHVISSLNKGDGYAEAAVRVTLGKSNTKAHADRLIAAIKEIITKYNDYGGD